MVKILRGANKNSYWAFESEKLKQVAHFDVFISRHECKNIYRVLDDVNKELQEFENTKEQIAKQAELFEVGMPEFFGLQQVRKELKIVKVC